MRDLAITGMVILTSLYVAFMAGYFTGRREIKVKYNLMGGRHR